MDTSVNRDMAEERRSRFEQWYRDLGFQIDVPKPAVSNDEFDLRERSGQQLFYRPASLEISYQAFMKAIGYGDHWTVTDSEWEKLDWEPTEQGYWFWADAQQHCPRLGMTWRSLSSTARLLALEEYAIIWYYIKKFADEELDRQTRTWLKPRFGENAAAWAGSAGEAGGGYVHFDAVDIDYESGSLPHWGGRAMEMVVNAT